MLPVNPVGPTAAHPYSYRNAERGNFSSAPAVNVIVPERGSSTSWTIHDLLCMGIALFGLGVFAGCDVPYSLFGIGFSLVASFYFVFRQMSRERSHPLALAKFTSRELADGSMGV